MMVQIKKVILVTYENSFRLKKTFYALIINVRSLQTSGWKILTHTRFGHPISIKKQVYHTFYMIVHFPKLSINHTTSVLHLPYNQFMFSQTRSGLEFLHVFQRTSYDEDHLIKRLAIWFVKQQIFNNFYSFQQLAIKSSISILLWQLMNN